MTVSKPTIRDELPADIPAISTLTEQAFKTLAISNHTEHFIIDALRKAQALTLSLVAELDGKIVGHIAFSPIKITDGTEGWCGLGPVAVLPEYQKQGIGKALINQGLARLQALGVKGCCLVGHPEYYGQFGFEHVQGLGLEGVPAEVFFALVFDGNMPQGNVIFNEAFQAAGKSDA